MKRRNLIYLLLLVLLSTSAHAQTRKGRFLLSGQSGIDLSRTHTNIFVDGEKIPELEKKQTSLKLQPAFGYFIINNLALGLQADYHHIKEAEKSAHQLSFMPAAIYYIPLKIPLRPFLQAGIGYGSISQKMNGASSSESFSGLMYGLGLGVSYFVNDYLSVDLSAQVLDGNYYLNSNSTQKIEALNLGVYFGLSILL